MKVNYVRDVIDLFDSIVEIHHKGQLVGRNDITYAGWIDNLAVVSIVDEDGIIIIETE